MVTSSEIDRNPITQEPQVRQDDIREQLFNKGERGQVSQIQLPRDSITALRGILYDIDPHLIAGSRLTPGVSQDPEKFFAEFLEPCLSRDPVLAKGEVRISGTGLHVILRFDKPIPLETNEDRKRWDGVIKVVQCALPIDPDSPSITALTRPIGALNTKSGTRVKTLHSGVCVTQEDVHALFERIKNSPFKSALQILTGKGEISPCPVCNAEGSKLSAGNYIGFCYGSCGKVSIAQLFDLFLLARSTPKMGGQ